MIIPDPIFSIPDPGTASKNLSILTQNIVSKLSWKYDPSCSYRNSDPDFLPISDPRSALQHCKILPDPGSGTLKNSTEEVSKVVPMSGAAPAGPSLVPK